MKNRSFLFLWIGQMISMLGSSVYSLALMWEMKELTGSTVMMSTVMLASVIPWILCGPFSGVLVDRWSKRTAMIWSDVVRAAIIGVLTVLLALNHVTPWALILGSILNSTVASVFGPAEGALLPLLVGKENVQQANSMTQGANILTQMAGPALGGFLVANVSMTSAFLLNGVSFLASVLSLLCVRAVEPVRTFKPLSAKQMVVEVKEGIDITRQIPIVRALIPVALVANFLFAPFELILIQYCTTVLHGGAQLFGTIGSFMAGGMFIGAVSSGALAKKIRKGRLMSIGFILSSLAMFGMAFTKSIPLALACATLFGIFNMMINISVMSIIQMEVPEDKMGRVFGSIGLLVQSAQPIAQASAGWLLSVFQVPTLMTILSGLQTVNSVYAASKKAIRQQA